jgi:lauroyl/myristoyl acyltransferase
VLVTAHFGNWELGGAVLASRGYSVHAVVLPYRSKRLERLFNHYRERRGIHTIPVGRAVRELIRCLEQGHVVALLADRDFSNHHHEGLFLGKPASLPRGPAWLSVQTGAPVLPVFMVREENDSFVMRFHPPLFPEELKTEERMRDMLNRVLEEEIAGRPHQWFIFEDFWETGQRHKGHRHE